MRAEKDMICWRLNEREQGEMTDRTIIIVVASGVGLSCVSSQYTNSTVGIVNVYSLHNAYRHKAQ